MISVGPVITKEGKLGYLDELFCAYTENCVCINEKQKETCKNIFGIVYHTHPNQGAGHAYELKDINPVEKFEIDDAVYLRE